MLKINIEQETRVAASHLIPKSELNDMFLIVTMVTEE